MAKTYNTFPDLLKNFDYQSVTNKLGYPTQDVFGRQYNPANSATTTGAAAAPAGEPGSENAAGFFRTVLSKNPTLSGFADYLNSLLKGTATTNLKGVDDYTKAIQQALATTSGITGDVTSGRYFKDLQSAAEGSAKSAMDQNRTNTESLKAAMEAWNTGQTGSLNTLKTDLAKALGQTTDEMRGQIGKTYTEALGANAEAARAAEAARQSSTNEAINAILARNPLGTALGGFNQQMSKRAANDLAIQTALQTSAANKAAQDERNAALTNLIANTGNINLQQTENAGLRGLTQGDNYYRQLAGIIGADAARQQQIIDLLGNRTIGNLQTDTQTKLAVLPQVLNQASLTLAPSQARSAALADLYRQLGYGAAANEATKWVSVGTPGGQAPVAPVARFAGPPATPGMVPNLPAGGFDLGYPVDQTAINVRNSIMAGPRTRTVARPMTPQYAPGYTDEELTLAQTTGMTPAEARNAIAGYLPNQGEWNW